ncbi:MAG: HipA N-terminal domain-containing protein [Lewinella sp.]|jgi:serine/threonine-protein kinase HipA|uniref:HipA N-terminal domain-containing protein n=1 Tax=Lewinella sp. TaxID=2004506 RepID=UPI003D6A11A9
MRKGEVYRNGEHLGTLTEKTGSRYHFIYTQAWVSDPTKPAVSLRLPKREEAYESEVLFPFFFNMLSEGVNRKLQSRQLKIDEGDHFGLLLATAAYDTIGAVTVREAEKE